MPGLGRYVFGSLPETEDMSEVRELGGRDVRMEATPGFA